MKLTELRPSDAGCRPGQIQRTTQAIFAFKAAVQAVDPPAQRGGYTLRGWCLCKTGREVVGVHEAIVGCHRVRC